MDLHRQVQHRCLLGSDGGGEIQWPPRYVALWEWSLYMVVRWPETAVAGGEFARNILVIEVIAYNLCPFFGESVGRWRQGMIGSCSWLWEETFARGRTLHLVAWAGHLLGWPDHDPKDDGAWWLPTPDTVTFTEATITFKKKSGLWV